MHEPFQSLPIKVVGTYTTIQKFYDVGKHKSECSLAVQFVIYLWILTRDEASSAKFLIMLMHHRFVKPNDGHARI